MLRYLVIAILSFFSLNIVAESDTIPHKQSFAGKVWNGVKGVLREFNNIDTTYIEPQRYKFTTTLMSTYSFEQYNISSKSGFSTSKASAKPATPLLIDLAVVLALSGASSSAI